MPITSILIYHHYHRRVGPSWWFRWVPSSLYWLITHVCEPYLHYEFVSLNIKLDRSMLCLFALCFDGWRLPNPKLVVVLHSTIETHKWKFANRITRPITVYCCWYCCCCWCIVASPRIWLLNGKRIPRGTNFYLFTTTDNYNNADRRRRSSSCRPRIGKRHKN